MNPISFSAFLCFVLAAGIIFAELPEPSSARSHYDLKDGLALQGYDAVSYFSAGAPQEGQAAHRAEFEGAIYLFASEANRQTFLANPDRYRPAYGGWCAWAMADGGKTRPNPKSFIVTKGRLFLFYDSFFIDTRAKWKAGDPPALERRADGEWAKLVEG